MFKILIKDMDSFEINKIIASILLTALIIIGIGKIVDVLFLSMKNQNFCLQSRRNWSRCLVKKHQQKL